MDIIFRLRFVLWILVLGLWGSLVYEFLQEEAYQAPQLTTIRNPFQDESPRREPRTESASVFLDGRRTPPDVKASPAALPAARAALPPPLPPGSALPPTDARVPALTPPSPLPMPPSGASDERHGNSGAPTSVQLASLPKPPPRAAPSKPEPVPAPPEEPRLAPRGPKAPPGFESAQTAHFTVFLEGEQPERDLLVMLEQLHSNLMLDLAAFATWAREERVTLYLFQTQASYQKFTGRPSWSGGASSVSKRTLYAYKSGELVGILAHELCHLYFDSFFVGGQPSPLWLSEGMATLVQVERGLAAPNWLKPNMDRLGEGEGYSLQELTRVQNLTGASDRAVRLWYTQSYSVVRFLMRSRWFVSYYQFCKLLRDGSALTKALYTSYGMPYNRLSALEHAWRYDIRTDGIRKTALDQTAAAARE